MRPLLTLTLTLAALAASAAETFEEMEKATDFKDPDSIYMLGDWCRKNSQHVRANKYFAQVIRIDPNHAPARAAMGQVLVGSRWVNAEVARKAGVVAKPATAGAAAGPAAGGGEAGASAGGKAPTAADQKWDLTLPVDPQPLNTFVDPYVKSVLFAASDSREMDEAVNTVVLPDNWPKAMPRLAKGLADPAHSRVGGISQVVVKLLDQGRRADALPLLPFLVTVGRRCKDGGELGYFLMACDRLRDKRLMPVMIELLGSGNADVVDQARTVVASYTGLNPEGLAQAAAQAWWNRNHARQDRDIFKEQLKNPDPLVSLSAAQALIVHKEPALVPVLIDHLRANDKRAIALANQLLTDLTGQDWGITPESGQDERASKVKIVANWWAENRERFVWPQDRGEKAVVAGEPAVKGREPLDEEVERLGAADGQVSNRAVAELLAKGKGAVPALVRGLSSESRIVRRRSLELLVRITGKSDIGFDPAGDAEERMKGVDAWTAWAVKEKLMTPPEKDNE